MRYLRKFNESLIGDKANDKIRIAGNIKDIFVGYQDSHDLDVDIETFAPGLGLPSTLMHLDDNVLMVKLFEQRGIRYVDIADEVGMLIEYMKSLTDKEVKIYYDIDRSGLRHWRPLAGNSEYEHDYNLDSNKVRSFNTIRIYFVESDGKKLNESLDIDDKVIEDITDMFVELKDAGINYLVSKEDPYLTVKGQDGIGIILHKNRNDATIDLELVKDCVEMAKDYLSVLFDFTEFYRFGFVWSTSPDSPKGSRSSFECNSFPDDLTKDIRKDLFASSYLRMKCQGGFYYELEGIKIVFIQK
jgi:hypothetical protein